MHFIRVHRGLSDIHSTFCLLLFFWWPSGFWAVQLFLQQTDNQILSGEYLKYGELIRTWAWAYTDRQSQAQASGICFRHPFISFHFHLSLKCFVFGGSSICDRMQGWWWLGRGHFIGWVGILGHSRPDKVAGWIESWLSWIVLFYVEAFEQATSLCGFVVYVNLLTWFGMIVLCW